MTILFFLLCGILLGAYAAYGLYWGRLWGRSWRLSDPWYGVVYDRETRPLGFWLAFVGWAGGAVVCLAAAVQAGLSP